MIGYDVEIWSAQDQNCIIQMDNQKDRALYQG